MSPTDAGTADVEQDDAPDQVDSTDRDDRPRRRRFAPYVAGAVGVVVLLFVVVLATRQPAADREQDSPLIGKQVPALSGTTLDGQPFDIDRAQAAGPGRWMLVNFFASWCTPCQVEHPELKKFHDEHAARGDAEVVSVPFQDSPEDMRAFFERNGGGWPVLADAKSSTVLDFGIYKLPESYLVAPNGKVYAKFVGGFDADEADQLIADAEARAAAGSGS